MPSSALSSGTTTASGAPTASAGPQLRAIIGGLERTIPLSPLPFTVGRRPTHPLPIPLPQVSRDHARIEPASDAVGGGFVISDLGSTHGTFVNGGRIQGFHRLISGDTIEFPNCPGVKIVFDPVPEAASLFLSQMQKLGESTHANEFDRLRLLLDFSARLRSAGGLEDILSAMLDAALRLTGAERGFVFLRDGDQQLRMRAGRTSQGKSLSDDSSISHSIVAKASQSVEAFIMNDSRQAAAPELAKSVVAHDLRTVVAIPLRVANPAGTPSSAGTVGVLYLDSHTASPELGRVSREMLDLLADDAAQVVINAQLAREQEEAKLAAKVLEKELNLAASIQQGLMGVKLPSVPYAKLDGLSQACLQIGGDFFEALVCPKSGAVDLVMADVSGKGAAAALLAASLQGLVHAQLLAGAGLDQIAALANQFICERLSGEKYATLVIARLLPSGEMEYINCGHIPPLVAGPAGCRSLEEGNMPVGLIPMAAYTAARHQLAPGERLFLVTDGVTEAANTANEMFGDSRLAECLARGQSVQEIAAEVRSFCQGAPLGDDLTLLEAHFAPAAAAVAGADA